MTKSEAPIASLADARAKKYFNSSEYKSLLKRGMDLVERAATYVDGQGRQDLKELNPEAKAAYAAESMKIISRLMFMASWLLLGRSVAEGLSEIFETRRKSLNFEMLYAESAMEQIALLPAGLKDIVFEANAIIRQIKSLEATYFPKEE